MLPHFQKYEISSYLVIKLYGAECFLRLRYSLSCSRNFPPFIKSEALLVCSQSLPVVCILSQINPVHILLLQFFKIHFNNILLFIPWSSKWSFHIRFSDQILNAFLTSPMCATWSANLIFCDQVILIILGENCRSRRSLLQSFLQPPFTSFLLDSGILKHPQSKFLP